MTDASNQLVLEIIELEDGELAIRNPENTEEEPILRVNFSDELKEKLDDQCLDVARVMLTAGIQMVAEAGVQLSEQSAEPDFTEDENPTIH